MNKVIYSLLLVSITSFAANDTFYLAVKANTMAMNYTETQGGATLDTEKSNLFGKIGGFNIDAYARVAQGFLMADATRIMLNYEYSNGNSNYTGSILGMGSSFGSYKDTTNNTIKRAQATISQVKYTPYGAAMLNLGIGNRTWNRNLSSSQTEDYVWNYLTAGLGFDFNLGSSFTLGALAYYQQAFSPTMQYNSSNFNNKFNLGSTNGYRIEVPASYKITQMFSVVGSWALDNWKINQSNSVNGYYEPPSTTNNQTLSLGLALKF
ncbi:MAG: hypothetical protein RL154_1450 [Pseudomonadota bacterium]|jgi:hypothetical protein